MKLAVPFQNCLVGDVVGWTKDHRCRTSRCHWKGLLRQPKSEQKEEIGNHIQSTFEALDRKKRSRRSNNSCSGGLYMCHLE